MKKLIILILMLLTGCSVPPKDPSMVVHVDTSFKPEEKTCIEHSAEVWRSQTSGLADFELIYDYNTVDRRSVVLNIFNNRLVRWTSNNPLLKDAEAEDGGTILGMVQTLKVGPVEVKEMRLVADRLTEPNICQQTTVHEFGHMLGIPHLGNKTSIMYPYVIKGRTSCLKEADLIAFCWLHSCGKVQMKPCEDDALPNAVHLGML